MVYHYHFEQIVEQVLESEESYLEQEEVTYEGITVKTPLNWKKLGEGEAKIRLERKEGIKGYVIVDKIIASKIESYEALISGLKEEMNLEEDWEVGYRIIQEELEQLASSLEWG